MFRSFRYQWVISRAPPSNIGVIPDGGIRVGGIPLGGVLNGGISVGGINKYYQNESVALCFQ